MKIFEALLNRGRLILTVAVMGMRMGLVVAAVVPLVTLSSLALFAWGGGVLHQISIAAGNDFQTSLIKTYPPLPYP